MKSLSRLKHFLGIFLAVTTLMPLNLLFGFLSELGLAGAAWSERTADQALAWGRAER